MKKEVKVTIQVGDKALSMTSKGVWNDEFFEDLKQYQNINAEKELMSVLMEQLSLEIQTPEFIDKAIEALV